VTPDELVLRIVQADADAAVAVIEEQTAALHHPPTLPLTATNETAGHKGSRVTSKICHNGFRERPGWDNESSTFERVRIGRKSCGKQTFGLGPVAAITTAGWVAGMG
jgi:hypothetical protein